MSLSFKNLALSLLAVTGLMFLLSPAIAMADCANPATTKEAVQCGSDNVSGTKGDAQKTLNGTITSIINILSVLVGIVAVIMIIIGGFRYITSGGDSTKVGAAKNTILYALIGLIIVAIAQVIVKFVLGKATKVTPLP